ncbi:MULTISPECIES: hypothetical protein [unclassified Pseudovibrio]|uniref:hypothetical protein n=1 Tax=unclassified Pseudovibrio TaxID=2627060 RepID=UPI0007B2E352|nr:MULTISPECIES: hypothetical protein [unclassified Pseudovibrio]KZL02222.1 hypothetical protein PsW74_01320 [Pseudovibrio sp. W74]KZL08233.1 hypothetical protein PsAD14_03380 [Pseudovibrio sp. Ad14]
MIIFDDMEHLLSRSIVEACTAAGLECVNAARNGGVQTALEQLQEPGALVISPPSFCEATALKATLSGSDTSRELAQTIEAEACYFLETCRHATQAMMRHGGGQVLSLGIDDVASKIVGLPQSPIVNQMRSSCIKSLAKEYGRLKISYNSVLCHPPKESVDPKIWRSQRDALKVYTMRFTPCAVQEYAEFCRQLLTSNAPLNGGQICLGKGVMETAA